MNKKIEISNMLQYDITKCNDDWEVPYTIYPYHRLYYIYSGEVTYESAEEQLTLEKNSFYLFPVNKEYSLSHNPDEPLYCIWFHFDLNHTILNNLTKLPIKSDSIQFYLLKALEELIKNKASVPIIISFVNTFLLLQQHDEQFVFVADERLDIVLDYIRNNYQSKLNNKQLANLLNHDSKYFIRLFKKTYGKTPHEYIASYRAYKAASLLLEDMQVKEVAIKVGFEDVKAFSRFFKAKRGICPSRFKKSYFLQP